MIWGAVWTSVFISTVFPIITLNTDEYKAFNLLERTNKRGTLELAASHVITNIMKIQRHIIKRTTTNIDPQYLEEKQVACLNKMRNLSKVRKEIDSLVIETLYFEDSMLTKLEMVLELNEQVTEIQLKIEDIYRQIFEITDFGDTDLHNNVNVRKHSLDNIKSPVAKNSKTNIKKMEKEKEKAKPVKKQVETSNSEPELSEQEKIDYLEPDSKSNVCKEPNRFLFDSMPNVQTNRQVIDKEDDVVVVHKYQPKQQKNIKKAESSQEENEPEADPPMHKNNQTLDWIVFVPLFITVPPADDYEVLPTYIQ